MERAGTFIPRPCHITNHIRTNNGGCMIDKPQADYYIKIGIKNDFVILKAQT